MRYTYIENDGFARRGMIDASDTTTDGGVFVYDKDGKLYWKVPSGVEMSTMPVDGERVHFSTPQWVQFLGVYKAGENEYYWQFQHDEQDKDPLTIYLLVVPGNGYSADLYARLCQTPIGMLPESLPDGQLVSELRRFF